MQDCRVELISTKMLSFELSSTNGTGIFSAEMRMSWSNWPLGAYTTVFKAEVFGILKQAD